MFPSTGIGYNEPRDPLATPAAIRFPPSQDFDRMETLERSGGVHCLVRMRNGTKYPLGGCELLANRRGFFGEIRRWRVDNQCCSTLGGDRKSIVRQTHGAPGVNGTEWCGR